MSKDRRLTKDVDNLFRAILNLKNKGEARAFFGDLLTPKEIEEFATRWKAANMLHKGVSYKEIAKVTNLSSRTIARINLWLKKGEGGYRLLIHRVK